MALRGVIAVIFGIIALRKPDTAAGIFVGVFAVFAFADGLLDFIIASTVGRLGRRWGWYVFQGIVSIAAGAVALAYPGITVLWLVILVGIRAIVHGVLELGIAISWKEIDSRWLLALVGVVSIMFGILLFASPVAGALALIWTIGLYAITLGIMLVVLGIRVARAPQVLA